MTIYETNRKRWADASEAAMTAWESFRAYKKSVHFVRDEVPGMLKMLDSDTKHIDGLRESNKKLRDALHAAGIDPSTVLKADGSDA